MSIAIGDGAVPIAEWESDAFMRHSETLVPALGEIFAKHNIKPGAIGCVAVGLGPGSFTGLRVGITTAKIFAYAFKIKIVGVSSLAAIAHASKLRGRVAVTRDARRGKVYAALYEMKNGVLRELKKPALLALSEFVKRAGRSAQFVDETVMPRASSVAALALESIRRKKFIDPFHLEPEYLYPKDCNVTRGLTPLGKFS